MLARVAVGAEVILRPEGRSAIRRALAQSVSDHWLLERVNKQTLLQLLVIQLLILFQISQKNEHVSRISIKHEQFSRKGFRNGLRNEQLLLFLAQIVVCSENRAREGGLSGSLGVCS